MAKKSMIERNKKRERMVTDELLNRFFILFLVIRKIVHRFTLVLRRTSSRPAACACWAEGRSLEYLEYSELSR